MKTATTICETCGAKIPNDVTGQVCPACFLEIGLGVLDDEFVPGVDSSAVASAQADDGVLAHAKKRATQAAGVLGDFGDYELQEEIGRGGQGVVYRTHQKSLNRTVALKVIGLGPWTTGAHLKRFRREAEAAASLQHPGIVPIYEVGEREGSCYFSMQFVEGGQLDELVRREPMPIRRAVELIAKVTRTVHYAHEHGILHRDIKPGNILLDQYGEPHLTDFGLARLVEADSTITGTLEVVGTPSYMAPEQAAGEQTKLSNATDVYGLGAVLYQLLTGHPVFAGGTTFETIKLLLETEPRPPRLLNPKVDRDLSAICLKCLEKDPKHRYASALALAEDLEHWLKHEPIRAKRSGVFTHTRKWVRRKPAATAVITLSLALGVSIAWNIWKREFNRHPVPNGVAVLPFENLSRDPDDAYLAEGIQDEIITRLAGIAGLRVISRSSVQHYQNKPRDLHEIAKQLGVTNILEGSLQKTADQVRVNVQLVNTHTDSDLWADTYDRKLTDILGVESDIAKEVADALQVKLSPTYSQALASAQTRDAEAYDLFLRGEYAFHQAESRETAEAFDRADGFYQQALARDPNFAEAAAELARSRLYRHWEVAPLAPEKLKEVKRIIDRALALAPNSPNAHLALASFFYWGHREYEKALTEFNRTLELQPNSALARKYRAGVYRRRGEWEHSLADFQRAQELDPRDSQIPTTIGMTFVALRQWKDAERSALRALGIDPHDLTAAVTLLRARLNATGNVDSARRTLDRFPEAIKSLIETRYGTGGDVAGITGVWPYLDVIEGRFTEAFQEFEKGVVNDELTHLTQLAGRAAIHVLAGQPEAAKSAGKEALPLLEATLREHPEDNIAMTELSWVYVALGRNADALRLSRQAADLLPIEKDVVSGPFFQNGLAQIEARTGEPEEAIKRLRHLLSIPAGLEVSIARLKVDPVWNPIRNRPDFQQLLSGPEQIGPNK
jgi:serine/threonine protein kinase/tetratricopeptide (TPR) repeat protein